MDKITIAMSTRITKKPCIYTQSHMIVWTSIYISLVSPSLKFVGRGTATHSLKKITSLGCEKREYQL
jgi:hypothetical protein